MKKVIFVLLIVVLLFSSAVVMQPVEADPWCPPTAPDGCDDKPFPMKCYKGNRKDGHNGHWSGKHGC